MVALVNSVGLGWCVHMGKKEKSNVLQFRQVQHCFLCREKLPPGKIKCTSCGAWNTGGTNPETDKLVIPMSEVQSAELDRIQTGPWDKALGGGMVKGMVIMLGALPGGGKTTIGLLAADATCEAFPTKNVLYISAEMRNEELKMYGDRLNLKHRSRILLASTIGGLQVIEGIEGVIDQYNPALVVLDSVPGLCGEDLGAAPMLCKLLKKEATRKLMPVLVINHVNAQEELAGLMKLQHEVDVLLLMEIDPDTGIRDMWATKNRGGAANVHVILEMTKHGLVEISPEGDEND